MEPENNAAAEEREEQDAVIERLAKSVGLGVAEAALLYLPALRQMALDELTAFVADLTGGRTDEARAALHEEMSPGELAAEKQALAGVAVLMADRAAEKKRIGGAILGAIMKAALSALLGAAVF